MVPIFNGELKGAGAFGGDFIFKVHGSVSEDGNWVESMFFSREVIRADMMNGELFRVTLRTLPMIRETDSENKNKAVCEKSGSDLQRFILEIEYANGILLSAQPMLVDSQYRYISTDFKSSDFLAKLKLSFVTLPPSQIGGCMMPGGM